MASPEPETLIVGAGGIGGVVAANLIAQGHRVTTLSRNPDIARAIQTDGFRVEGPDSPGVVRGPAVTDPGQLGGPYDLILLATQPPSVEAAAAETVDHLAPDGRVVCFQNGLCEPRVARIVGEARTIGAIVAWGASALAPGAYERTSAGGFTIGRIDGSTDAPLERLALMLEAIGPVTVTDNLLGARWSKLAINCAISSLGTLGRDRLGALLIHRFVRRLALEIMTEAVQVAQADGIRLEKVSGTIDLPWIALTDRERRQRLGSPSLFTKHALLLAVGARYRKLRSSMLRAIERGRPPAVDFLNGEVTLRGAAHGTQTPINREVTADVHRLARGEIDGGLPDLRALFERTRSLVAAPDATG